uniref:ATP synthase F1 complex delta/epsilon subunit N-terminal domain-containing protein n=1 Tax=Chlamydomonas euryale TaxID=1486919 RepID=A0A7R9YRU9_9CHLO
MLRQAARRLLAAGQRGLTTSAARLEEVSVPAGPKEFAETWSKKAPSQMAVPEFPSNFLKASAQGESLAQGDMFPVNFYTPSGALASMAQKDSVILPGVDGYFGLKANHVPLISQLIPGVIELHNGAEMEKFFISGGFAFVHPNGVTDICVLEATTLDQVDGVAVKSALAQAQGAQGQGDEEDQTASRAAVELYSALDAAMDSKA